MHGLELKAKVLTGECAAEPHMAWSVMDPAALASHKVKGLPLAKAWH